MKTKLVRIGNSRGIRIPKPLIEQAGLENEVVLRVVDDGIVIEPVGAARAGWADAAQKLHETQGDGLLDESIATEFDEIEWVWE